MFYKADLYFLTFIFLFFWGPPKSESHGVLVRKIGSSALLIMQYRLELWGTSLHFRQIPQVILKDYLNQVYNLVLKITTT